MVAQRILYSVLISLIWGSTWIAIKHQQTVPVEQSILYRFALTFVVLWGIFLVKGHKRHPFTLKDHGFLALIGITNFSLNYVLAYTASEYLKSGVVSVIFSLIVVFNMVNAHFLLKKPTGTYLLIGGLLGITGILSIFGSEFRDLHYDLTLGIGFVTALLGAYVSSLGNIIAERNGKAGFPQQEAMVWGTFYGMLLMGIFTLVIGNPLQFDWSLNYILSMGYLVFFGTILNFYLYFSLIRMHGATETALSVLFIPVVSMTISSLFEGFNWSLWTWAGILLLLYGNYIVLMKGPK